MATKLTDTVIKRLGPAPAGTRYYIEWDADIKGFGIRVTEAGTKGFILNYRNTEGRERRYTIGDYPAWSVAAARDEAARLRREIDGGADPVAERKQAKEGATVSDLCDRYLTDYAKPKKRESSQKADEGMIENIIKPKLGKSKVASVTYSDIDHLHRKLAEKTPYRANRVLALLSKMFNLAIRWGYVAVNPCKGVERAPEHKRTRYLSPEELRRLTEALATYPYLQSSGKKGESPKVSDKLHPAELQSANAIRLLLLTGARRGEVLNATWDQFDLTAGIWTKPGATTKQKTEHRVPLSAPVRQLLADMQKEAGESIYLFPGKTPDEPQTDLKHAWATICELADIDGLRLHDLRHSYASILASAGLSLPIIGALLGHTQPGTTARYAHLFDDPLRQATERVGALVSHAETGKTGEVVKLTNGKKGGHI